MKKRIAQIGPLLGEQGGISTVIESILGYPDMEDYHLIFIGTTKTKPDLFLYLRAVHTLQRLCKRREIDIAHIHMSAGGSFLRKAVLVRICAAQGIPVVLHMHSGQFRPFFDRLGSLMQRYCVSTFSKIDCVIALSDDVVPFFTQTLSVRRVEVVVNSVEVPETPARTQGCVPPVFLFLGRLGKRKATYELIQAVRLLRESGYKEPFRLLLAGDGDTEQYAAMVKQHKLEDTITLTGWIGPTEKEAFLRTASAIVLPSYAEGCPMSLLEGMSYALPALGSDIPPIVAVVRDGVDGLIFPVGDSDAMMRCLRALLEDPEGRRRMGENARIRVVEKFSHGKAAEHLRKIYEIVLRGL